MRYLCEQVVIALLVMSNLPAAAEWNSDYGLGLGGEYNDNWLLNDDDALASAAATLDLQASLGRDDGRLSWALGVDGTRREFEDEALEALLDWELSLGGTFLQTRALHRLNAGYARESGLVGGFDDDGRIALGEERNRVFSRYGGLLELSPRRRLIWEFGTTDIEYDDTDGGFLRADTRALQGSLGLDYELDPRTRVTAQILAQRYDSDRDVVQLVPPFVVPGTVESRTDQIGPGMVIDHQAGPTLTLSARASYRVVETVDTLRLDALSKLGLDSDDFTRRNERGREEWFGGFDVTKELPLGTYGFSYDRFSRPTSNGAFGIRDRAGMTWRRRFSDRTTVIGAGYLLIDRTDEASDRDAVSASISLAHELSRRIKLYGAYGYRRQNFEEGGDASGHSISLTLRFRG